MLAGLDALLEGLSPLPSVLGLVVSCLFLRKGTDGIAGLNLFLVPLLLLFVFLHAGNIVLSYPSARPIRWGWLLYAGMNAFLLAPVLMDAGAKMRHPLLSSFLAAGIVFAAGVCILGSICREGANAIGAEMPFLKVAAGSVFFLAVACAILTSLVSSLYIPFSACNALGGKKKIAAKAIVLLAAFLLSRIGLKGIVGGLYPLIGGAGLFFSALCIFYDNLFKKHHERVHSRREDAEDKGRTHHEVKLEHLPAVHDEIAEPRP